MCRNLSCRCSPASTRKRDEFSTSDSICYKCFSKMESKSIEEEQRIRVGIKAHKILLIQLHDINLCILYTFMYKCQRIWHKVKIFSTKCKVLKTGIICLTLLFYYGKIKRTLILIQSSKLNYFFDFPITSMKYAKCSRSALSIFAIISTASPIVILFVSFIA